MSVGGWGGVGGWGIDVEADGSFLVISPVPGDRGSHPQTHTCTLTAPTVSRRLQTQQEVCFYVLPTLVSVLLLLLFFWQPFFAGLN